ncbi:MAG: hypothetical protein ACPMAQ_00170 [Phycisphaerae bacterium]
MSPSPAMIPDRSAFRPREWHLVRRLRTPQQVQRFLKTLPYNRETRGDTLRTFRGVLRHRTAHCLEAALTAATILEQHGYPPLLLDLASSDRLDHVLFLFERNGRFGTVGRSRFPGLHGRKPVFSSVEDLVEDYVEPFVDFTGRLVAYAVADLRNVRGVNWRFSERNVWAVERYLIRIRHRRIRTSDALYRRYLERYRRYKERYPDREPAYYPRKDRWL